MEEKQRLGILSWAEEDRPREKLLLKGRTSLSDAELMGILIGSGTRSLSAVDVCKIILQDTGQDLNQLAKLSVRDLQKFKGIGEAKAITIVAALELGRRRKETISTKRITITCSQDAYDAIKPELWDLPHEEFWLLMLNRANQVIRKERCSAGGMAGTVTDPKIIFKAALEHRASSLILVHNHPSGNTKPSEADLKITKKLKEAGALLDIPVLDHLIFTDGGYYSFADEGIL